MEKYLERQDAILCLAMRDVLLLDSDARAHTLANYWPPDDLSFLIAAFPFVDPNQEEQLPEDSNNALYNPILIGGIAHSYQGVTNIYLTHQLALMGLINITVKGDIEKLVLCPCCHYYSLSSYTYAVCPICHWENDGTHDEDTYSAPNHQTLSAYRQHFQQQPFSEMQRIKYVYAKEKSGQ